MKDKRMGNQTYITYRILSEASGVSQNTIRKYVKLFQELGLDEVEEDD
jgi:hypothetical protein